METLIRNGDRLLNCYTLKDGERVYKFDFDRMIFMRIFMLLIEINDLWTFDVAQNYESEKLFKMFS